MMNSIARTMHNLAKGKTIVVSLVVTLAVYLYMILVSIPRVTSHAGDMKIFDLQPFGYTESYARELLSTIGEEGRAAYLYQQIPVDLVYPGLFAVTYALLLAWLFKRAFGTQSYMNVFIFVPVAAGILDYAENVGVIVMLTSFPHFSATVVVLTSAFTILKSLFTVAFFGLAGAALIGLLKARFHATRG